MTIMAQKIQLKNTWTNSAKQTTKEAIHSGHFMVSDFEAEAQDDEDELAVPVPEEVENKTPILSNQIQILQSNEYHLQRSSWHQLSIETSLSKLFQCMSLAYRQKLTSPKWNRFKGIRLRWKDKIRLNNVIWRCWHMQFINKKNTPICQFASPLDVDTHNKPEAVVLEGKYWKRKLNAVTAEYKKWRMYCHNQILGKPQRYHEMFPELDSQECWAISGGDSMMVDEDYMGLMTDTLFSTITAQPFPFPDPREIARNTNIADFIQPSLVQLQPNLDEIMEIEPLHDFLQCSKLTTVPEESGVLQTVPSYQTKLLDTIGTAYQQQPASTIYTSTDSMWYLPPEYVEVAAAASLPPPPYPQTAAARCLQPTSANNSSNSNNNNNNNSNNSNSNTTNASVNNRQQLVQPPQQQSQLHLTTASPPTPPPPPVTKNEIFTTPKSKTKGRGRNNAKKGPAFNANNNINNTSSNNSNTQSMMMPAMTSTSAAVAQLQQQIQQKQPSSSSLQNSTLLAQILTSNSSASYGFIPKEQQPSNKLVTLNTAGNCEEVPPFMQQTFSTPVENQLIYKTDKNIHKSAGTTYMVNNDNNANKSVVTSVTTSQRTTSPGMTSVLNRTVPSPLNNMGTGCGSADSLATSDPLSLSPLNVGSPTSPIGTKEAQPVKEQRRVCHINAEQKRRCNIKNGFDTLHSLIPQLSQNPNAKMSKASMLQKGAEYIRQLRIERNNLKQEIDSLRQEIDTLNTAICNCQALLPATGAPISRQRNSKMRDMFKQYVKSRTHENWKFWLLSLICEPLLESFNNCVSTNSLDELYHTTLQWVDQHCTLVILRQVVLNSFRQLCTTTEVLTDPARLPTEARAAVDRPNKKQS